jgi:hypothetical protein
VAADSETEPDVSNEISSREASGQGAGTPRPSLMGCSQIVGLHPGEVFWPETILPAVLPETRIFTWGYDADVDTFNTSVGHNTVEQHANDLLTDIANLSEKLGSVGGRFRKGSFRTDYFFGSWLVLSSLSCIVWEGL